MKSISVKSNENTFKRFMRNVLKIFGEFPMLRLSITLGIFLNSISKILGRNLL